MLLQNPFDFAASDAAADTAAVSLPHAPAPDAAATPFEFGVYTVSMPDEAAAFLRQSADAAVEFPDIGEIFVGARKLDQLPGIFDQDAITGPDELLYVTLKLSDNPHERDLPDVPQGLIEAMEPMPMFLRRAVG